MAELITMPKLGFDMAEGTLVRWLKAEGDPLKKGEVIAEIETDKATVEVESGYAGVMLRHLADEGADLPVNAPIAIVADEGEALSMMRSTPCWLGRCRRLESLFQRMKKRFRQPKG